MSILDRHGLPFLLRGIKRRLLLPAGLALCLAFIVHLAGYIWFVEIHGHESLSLGELRLAAEELGLNAGGVRRASIAPRRIEKELLLRFPSLAWAEVELKGGLGPGSAFRNETKVKGGCGRARGGIFTRRRTAL